MGEGGHEMSNGARSHMQTPSLLTHTQTLFTYGERLSYFPATCAHECHHEISAGI